VYKYFLRPGKNLRKYGAWAVVTGATDGIGKAYAFELAKQGLNVILISRTQSKLDACAEEIRAKYPTVQVDTLSIDFTSFGPNTENYGKVIAKLRDLDVGVLINNVGMSYPFPKRLMEIDDSLVQNLIVCNINSVTYMTRIVYPGMVERKRGAVVNISSALGRMPSPLTAVYGATKAYVENFSVSVNAENDHVHVQCQSPMFVSTKLAKIRNASITVPSPTSYARCGIRAIGYDTQISPHWAHALQQFVTDNFPQALITWYVNKVHKGLRKRGIKKEERKAREAAAAK